MYPMDPQMHARVRAQDWEREVTEMRLAKEAMGTRQSRAASGKQTGRMLVEMWARFRASVTYRHHATTV